MYYAYKESKKILNFDDSNKDDILSRFDLWFMLCDTSVQVSNCALYINAGLDDEKIKVVNEVFKKDSITKNQVSFIKEYDYIGNDDFKTLARIVRNVFDFDFIKTLGHFDRRFSRHLIDYYHGYWNKAYTVSKALSIDGIYLSDTFVKFDYLRCTTLNGVYKIYTENSKEEDVVRKINDYLKSIEDKIIENNAHETTEFRTNKSSEKISSYNRKIDRIIKREKDTFNKTIEELMPLECLISYGVDSECLTKALLDSGYKHAFDMISILNRFDTKTKSFIPKYFYQNDKDFNPSAIASNLLCKNISDKYARVLSKIIKECEIVNFNISSITKEMILEACMLYWSGKKEYVKCIFNRDYTHPYTILSKKLVESILRVSKYCSINIEDYFIIINNQNVFDSKLYLLDESCMDQFAVCIINNNKMKNHACMRISIESSFNKFNTFNSYRDNKYAIWFIRKILDFSSKDIIFNVEGIYENISKALELFSDEPNILNHMIEYMVSNMLSLDMIMNFFVCMNYSNKAILDCHLSISECKKYTDFIVSSTKEFSGSDNIRSAKYIERYIFNLEFGTGLNINDYYKQNIIKAVNTFNESASDTDFYNSVIGMINNCLYYDLKPIMDELL